MTIQLITHTVGARLIDVQEVGKSGADRKRRWRLNNPEKSRAAERERALARRRGYWGEFVLGQAPRSCASSHSYWKHEHSFTRIDQRFWYEMLHVPGAHKMTKKERSAVIDAQYEAAMAALETRWSAYCEQAGLSPDSRDQLRRITHAASSPRWDSDDAWAGKPMTTLLSLNVTTNEVFHDASPRVPIPITL